MAALSAHDVRSGTKIVPDPAASLVPRERGLEAGARCAGRVSFFGSLPARCEVIAALSDGPRELFIEFAKKSATSSLYEGKDGAAYNPLGG